MTLVAYGLFPYVHDNDHAGRCHISPSVAWWLTKFNRHATKVSVRFNRLIGDITINLRFLRRHFSTFGPLRTLLLHDSCEKMHQEKNERERKTTREDAEALSYDLQKMLNMNISINTTLIDISNRI